MVTPETSQSPSPKPTTEPRPTTSEISLQQPERQPSAELGLTPLPPSAEKDQKPVNERIRIVDSSFEVRPGQMVYYKFTLNTLSRVNGDFQASGGRNDISAYIVDEPAFSALYGNSPFRFYYSSYGYVSYGQIDVVLKSGTYYAVYDNRRSIITAKMETAHLNANSK
ncbi:MAG: hypothetical protein ACRD9S_02780 [Pyrinomonadaceae bacterium]